jgi:glutathione peroxidase
MTTETVLDFTVKDIKGKDYPLSQHKGQVLMIMNVASKCGYTDKGYDTANTLFEKYHERGFNILAFPCNQFLSQEPGDNASIEEFACSLKKAQFPIMDKIDVNGKNVEPLWKMMKDSLHGFLGTTAVKWNFTKFLIDRDGVPRFRYGPGDSTEKIEKDLLTLL